MVELQNFLNAPRMCKNMQYADFATYAIACAIVCSHITGIPVTVQVYTQTLYSVQRALLAPEILNESFLKCRYFTALYSANSRATWVSRHFDTTEQFRWDTAPPVIRLKLQHQFCGAEVSCGRSVRSPRIVSFETQEEVRYALIIINNLLLLLLTTPVAGEEQAKNGWCEFAVRFCGIVLNFLARGRTQD